MGKVLKGVPDEPYPVPSGVVQAKIDPLTGLRVGEDESGLYEYFYQEFLPPLEPSSEDNLFDGKAPEEQEEAAPVQQDQLF